MPILKSMLIKQKNLLKGCVTETAKKILTKQRNKLEKIIATHKKRVDFFVYIEYLQINMENGPFRRGSREYKQTIKN